VSFATTTRPDPLATLPSTPAFYRPQRHLCSMPETINKTAYSTPDKAQGPCDENAEQRTVSCRRVEEPWSKKRNAKANRACNHCPLPGGHENTLTGSARTAPRQNHGAALWPWHHSDTEIINSNKNQTAQYNSCCKSHVAAADQHHAVSNEYTAKPPAIA
jgi:hypothetical protein